MSPIRLDQIPETEPIRLDQIPDEPLRLDQLPEEEHPALITDFGKSIMSGFARIAEGWIGLEQRILPYLRTVAPTFKAIEYVTGKKSEEELVITKEFFKKTREYWKPTGEGKAVWVATTLGEAIPQVLTGIATAGIGGLPLAGLNAYVVESDSAYQSAKARGASEDSARLEGDITGIINAAIEMWGVSKFLKFAKSGKGSAVAFAINVRNKLWKQAAGDLYNIGGDMLKQAIVEGIEESSQEGVSIAVPAVVSGYWPKKPDGTFNWQGVLSQIGEAGLGGGLAGGIVGGGLNIFYGTPALAMPNQQEISDFSNRIKASGLNDIEKSWFLKQIDPTKIIEKRPFSLILNDAGLLDVKATETQLPEIREGDIRLYRAEGGKLKHEDIWLNKDFPLPENFKLGESEFYTNDLKYAKYFLDTYGKDAKIHYIDIPKGLVQKTDLPYEFFVNKSQIKSISSIESLRNKFDDVVSKLEELRPTEKEVIRKERGKRFGEFREIVKDTSNPRLRVLAGKAALKGRLKIEIPPLESYFTSEDMDNTYDTITRSTLLTEGDLLSADEALQKMFFDGIIPARSELKPLVKCGLLTEQTAARLLDKRGRWQKVWDNFLDISYAPWSLLTSFDMSAAGRQGWKILFKNPKLWGRSLGRAYRTFASEDYYNFADLKRKTHPLYQQAIQDGIDETGLGQFQAGEERFLSKLVQKIPGIRASGRAYVGMLNELRFGWYNQAIEAAGEGLTKQQRKDIATVSNDLTGRGKLPQALTRIQNIMPIFFAPRWVSSQIRSITDLATMTSPARKMLAGTLANFFGFTLATLFLLDHHPELEVEWNPLSSDFLKIRYGNTRIGITSGYEQIFRTIWQLGAGKRKATETKHLQTAERKEIIWRFIQSKLSPTAGLAVDLFRGETFRGKKITLAQAPEDIYERITPLFIQDVIDAMRYQGIGTSVSIAPLAFHGLTVQTYPATQFQETVKLKDQLAGQYFNGQIWDEIGPVAQKTLRENFPKIGFYEDRSRFEREDVDFTAKIANESFNAGQKIYKNLSKSVKQEMEYLAVPMSGVSRYIGNSWYLNDKRYNDYQSQVRLLLDAILPDLVTDQDWKLLPLDVRRTMLKEIIDRCTAKVRLNITTQANIQDLQKLQ